MWKEDTIGREYKIQVSITETNESIIKLLITYFSLRNKPLFSIPQQVKFRNQFLLYWNECVTLKHIFPPAPISHRSFGNPSFQAVLFRYMIIFEILAPINHCSSPHLLSSYSSVLDCKCCVNCLLFWCSTCTEFWQTQTKCSQLTFGQKMQQIFLTWNLMPTCFCLITVSSISFDSVITLVSPCFCSDCRMETIFTQA